jgi:PKD repeat protein
VNVYPRLYHSNALLLPDATVLLAGGNPTRGTFERHLEIYSPAYLFKADGTAATRPVITSITPAPPASVGYGATFQVQTPDASNIGSVALVRPGAPTHAFDMEQRHVKLAFTAGSGVLNVTTPPNGNIAPPGYYMLFILNSAGTPSIATFVRLAATAGNQAPTAAITSPSSDVTINAGQALSFTGTGTDPDGGTIAGYSWSFPGGTPSASTSQSPTVTYSTPGTRTASLTVTDNGGLSSSPATRTVTVADFSLSATPSSQSVTAGNSGTYTVTVNPGAGFSGSVALSVTSGLPTGASAAFNPASILTSGSSTLTVSTSASTPAGSYTLTITGDTGVFTRTTTTTLVVSPPTVPSADFSISVSPASALINRGDKTSFTVTITGQPGFNSPVTLTVSGLPRFASSRFSTSSVTGSGTATLTINTNKNVSVGSSTLTVTGTSGSLVHSQTVTLTIGQ